MEEFTEGRALGGDGKFRLLWTGQQLSHLRNRIGRAGVLSFDTETTGTDPRIDELVGFSAGLGGGEAYFVPVRAEGFEEILKFVLSRSLILQNAKFDWQILRSRGELKILDDTMIMAYLMDVNRPSLKLRDLARSELGREAYSFEDIAAGHDPRTLDEGLLARHGCEDADNTFELWRRFEEPVYSRYGRVYKIEKAMIPVVARMEMRGVLLDGAILDESREYCLRERERKAKELRELLGPINLTSPAQVGRVFVQKFNIPLKNRTSKGEYSLDKKSVLAPLRGKYPAVDLYIEWKELDRAVNVVIDALAGHVHPRTGRIHSSFFQVAVFTGRMNSTNPNLQNIPKEKGLNLRRAFVPCPGRVLIALDFEQLEVRILLLMSQSPALERVRRGGDVHRELAGLLYSKRPEDVTPKEREDSKRLTYAIIYDVSEAGLAEALGCSRIRAAAIMAEFHRKVPGIDRFTEHCRELAGERGYAESMFGRRRNLPELKSDNAQERGYGLRSAVNHVIAGTASDLYKLAAVRLDGLIQRAMKEQADIMIPIHDEFIIEADANGDLSGRIKRLAEAMTIDLREITLPVGVEIGLNWGEMKPLEKWTADDTRRAIDPERTVRPVQPPGVCESCSVARAEQIFFDDIWSQSWR